MWDKSETRQNWACHFLSWKYAKAGFHFDSRHKKYMNITTCHWMHIKLIKMLSVLIVSSASVLGVYLNIKLTVEPNWKGDMYGMKWEKIFILKSLKLHQCVFPNKKKCIAPFEDRTVSVLIESGSFVIISSSNNSCVAFSSLIIHGVLIYVLISLSLTPNCQARVILSSTADCELLILSSFMYSSVPYADGASPWKLVLSSIWGSLSLAQMFCFETGFQVNGVSLSAVQAQHQEHKASPCCISPMICLAQYLPFNSDCYHTFRRKMQETSNGCLEMICPCRNFLFSHIICQAIYLQNHTSFLGGMAGFHLCDMFLISLSEFSLSVWTLVKFFFFFEKIPASDR